MAKPYIEVISIRERKDGDCDIKLEVNQAGKDLLIETGVKKALSDYIEANTGKLSFWDKLKICWSILK